MGASDYRGLNRVPAAVNYAAGREVLPPIKRPFGGSESLKAGMGVIDGNALPQCCGMSCRLSAVPTEPGPR
jgi:hypothetical protein